MIISTLNKQAVPHSRPSIAPISPIYEIIEDLRQGKMVIMVDDENRENEGDLIVAAEFATPEVIAFMARQASGLICLAITEDKRQQLDLPMMPRRYIDQDSTAFTVSIEAKTGVTTGISASDRSHTIQTAIHSLTTPEDIVTPGHVFPLVAKQGGVLERAGHTEASIDLMKMARLNPTAVICEIIKDDGDMARLNDLRRYAAIHQIKIGTIEELIHFSSQYSS